MTKATKKSMLRQENADDDLYLWKSLGNEELHWPVRQCYQRMVQRCKTKNVQYKVFLPSL